VSGGDCRINLSSLITPGVPFMVVSAAVEYHVAALPVGMTVALELFNEQPAALADNAAWAFPAGDRGKHIGSISLGAPVDRGATLKVEVDNINKLILPGAALWGILLASAGFIPAGNSEVLAVTLAGYTPTRI
jgi:hypothetical protein